MKAYTIVGWAYEADFHCCECAEKRFPLYRVSDSGRELEGFDNEENEITPFFHGEIPPDERCGDCGQYLY